ncbi:putative transmembrane protein [Rubellimicrobium mesophilum DSM 19309]|uniref:Putative transmembrane protein n=1 Tax=Rubellimicrobium mesophilum DSM 19309 TaxID=442562 RepID=A0A017HEM2_9RHOB|nr:SMR family transporter [Rubellimicrobium mesophilum]EYD72952.1 putative transmembrane protein [Rubellimicrobium mesophilum DSM 19309]
MSSASILWLAMAMGVFVLANSVLRAYSASTYLPTLVGALLLFSLGNLMMVRLMRESGLALAISVSSVVQLVLISLVAVLWFGERPSPRQLAGMALGVVAVVLIAWPQGGEA